MPVSQNIANTNQQQRTAFENSRTKIVVNIKDSYGGVNRMRARAVEAMLWPGMNADIQRTRDKCKTCRQTAPSQASTPPKPLPVPDYPFQMMNLDYFKLNGHHCLVMACRYSGWSTIYKTKDNTSTELISRLQEHIVTFGVTAQLWHRVSSAYNPH